MKRVYIAMTADILHHGHMKIIAEGRKYGEVMVGVLTDEVISGYKRIPLLNFDQRKIIVENIKGVSQVVLQDTLDYSYNLRKYKPDFVIHGDDWKEGIQREIRNKVIEVLAEWGGKLVEIPYTKEVSISKLDDLLKDIGITPENRKKNFRKLLELRPIVRIMEAHNGLTGLIVEKTKIIKAGQVREFDAIWVSSLCDSAAKGKPDTELVDFSSRLNTVNDILDITTKPIVFDGDSGGNQDHFGFMVKTLDRLGVSAIIIEDKIGPKRNSLLNSEVIQIQDSIESFSNKLSCGKKNKISEDFMIFARIESFITKAGQEDALSRAKAYIAAGADGIMIHSKSSNPSEVLSFCKEYKNLNALVPLVCVPTTYSQITEAELINSGINVVIYANHLLRSAYPAMVNTTKMILENERSLEAGENCMPIEEILSIIPGGNSL